jgi:hypothetical protein
MHDVFYWLTGHELEAHRILSLADRNESDVMRTCGDYYQTYNDESSSLYPDNEAPINGYVDYNGEMVCISCLFGWIFEFGAAEPANYVRYTGCCHMICSQCDTPIQPWKY